jgi:hypothetical protein
MEKIKKHKSHKNYVFTDPGLGVYDLSKTLKEKEIAIRKEYEDYFKIHISDGSFTKSKRSRKL